MGFISILLLYRVDTVNERKDRNLFQNLPFLESVHLDKICKDQL